MNKTHKYNNFKLRLPFNISSKTHWVPVWKTVHNIEPLPSYIWWNMHFTECLLTIATFPQVFGFDGDQRDNDDVPWE